MKIEIRLKTLLQQYQLDTKGVTQKLAQDLKVHRHSIGKLYRNQVTHPSLELIGQVCGWLIEHGVPAQVLPQQLFGSQAMQLWEAMAASGNVTFYLGEYQQETGAPTHGQRWISRRDSEAANGMVHHLSAMTANRRSNPQFRTVYVAFRALNGSRRSADAKFKEDINSSRRLFERMRCQSPCQTSILIGSQRVNYLLEHLIADMFHCKPFQTTNVGAVPFHLQYRPTDVAPPSCFGGCKGPSSGEKAPGVYFLSKTHGWVHYPWELRERDAGVVVVIRDPGSEALEIALFGFSGRATVVLGRHIFEDARKFWPPTTRTQDKEVGVYICRIEFLPITDDSDFLLPEAKKVEVIPLEETILKERL
jgi:hypothetical protein